MAGDLENILSQVGEIGTFQKLLIVLVSITQAGAAWGMLIMTLAGAIPDWWCGKGISSFTSTSMLATTIHPVSHSGSFFATTLEYSALERNDSNTTRSKYCPTDGSFCPNLTFSSEFTSIVSEWNLVCSRQWASGIITTIQMIGVMVGAACIGQLGDIVGRKISLFSVYTLLLVTNLITAFSVSVEMYTTLRFFVGMATGGIIVISFVLPVEYIGKNYRAFTKCAPLWELGSMLMAGLAYFIRDWRKLAITISGIGTPFLLTWWFIPESARWLMARKRYGEAESIFRKIAKINKRPPLSHEEFKTFIDKSEKGEEDQKTDRKYTFIDLFRTWKYAKISMLLFAIWIMSALVYYGLTFGVKNLQGDRYVNLLLNAAVDLPSYIYVPMMHKIGRRFTILILYSLAVLSSFGILIMYWAGYDNSDVVSALSLCAKLCMNGGWMVLSIYTTELYPTVIRNLGTGACGAVARIGAMVSPLLVETHHISPSIPYSVFAAAAAFAVICTLMLDETKGQPIPDFLSVQTHDLEDVMTKEKYVNETERDIELI